MAPRPKRKTIPDRIKLQVALKRMNLTIQDVEFDHSPALALRETNPETGDTIPPANDPEFIVMLTIPEHREKTFGKGGEKRATTAGSDIHVIAKTKRLEKQQREFRERLLRPTSREEKPTRKSKWPSRPFQNAKRNKERSDG